MRWRAFSVMRKGCRAHQCVAQPIELADDLLLRLMVGQRNLHASQ